MSNASETNLKHSNGFYGKIETLGNKIPDPMIFFLWFSVIVLVASWIFSALGASAINPATGETVVVYNLITRDGIIKILTNMLSTPMELLLVVLLKGISRSMPLQISPRRSTVQSS